MVVGENRKESLILVLILLLCFFLKKFFTPVLDLIPLDLTPLDLRRNVFQLDLIPIQYFRS